MRSTKASAAVSRLNARDAEYRYSFGITAAGFHLLRSTAAGPFERVSADLTMDEFVELVDRIGPQKKVRTTRLDRAFEEQLSEARKKAEE